MKILARRVKRDGYERGCYWVWLYAGISPPRVKAFPVAITEGDFVANCKKVRSDRDKWIRKWLKGQVEF